jgi:Tfp pilus assembly protein PilO
LWLAVIFAALVTLHWLREYNRLEADLKERAALAREDLSRAKILMGRKRVFPKLQQKNLEELAALRLQVPETLDIEAFLESFETWAVKAGIGVEETSYEQEVFDLYERASITARLTGSDEVLVDWEEALNDLERLVEFVDVRAGPGNLEATFFIFSLPASPSEGYQNPCSDVPDRALWLRPISLTVVEEELVEVCDEVKRKEDLLEQMATYLHTRDEIEKLRRFVEFIEKGE